MNEEGLKQKAKDFIDRIGKESGGNWLDKYYLTDLLVIFATEVTKELEVQIEKMINEIDKTMILSTMYEHEICDIQDIFRKYGFKRNSNNTWEIKENARYE